MVITFFSSHKDFNHEPIKCIVVERQVFNTIPLIWRFGSDINYAWIFLLRHASSVITIKPKIRQLTFGSSICIVFLLFRITESVYDTDCLHVFSYITKHEIYKSKWKGTRVNMIFLKTVFKRQMNTEMYLGTIKGSIEKTLGKWASIANALRNWDIKLKFLVETMYYPNTSHNSVLLLCLLSLYHTIYEWINKL